MQMCLSPWRRNLAQSIQWLLQLCTGHINFRCFIAFSLPMSACQNTGLLSSELKSESCRNISVKLSLETTFLLSKQEPVTQSKILFFLFQISASSPMSEIL